MPHSEKQISLQKIGEFHPIPFWNAVLKIVAKAITYHMKLILLDIIHIFRSMFVSGWLITNNTLITFDYFHCMRKNITKKKKALHVWNWTCQKLMIELSGHSGWPFWTTWISVNIGQHLLWRFFYSVFLYFAEWDPLQKVISLEKTKTRWPPMPLSFYSLCINFSGLRTKPHENRVTHGIQIVWGASILCHLFFADDSLTFLQNYSSECWIL